jgi:SOS response regulatory protein OraA/RecX
MTSQELYDHAVSLLARRDYASGELARTLSKMTENREKIDKALSRLVECGYLDDNRLITHMIDKHVRKNMARPESNRRSGKKVFLRSWSSRCWRKWMWTGMPWQGN